MDLQNDSVTFFHVSPNHLDGSGPDLRDVNGNSCRQRRRHGKSKWGCQECKKRRVKCDENRPICRNCARRKTRCSLEDLTPEILKSNPGLQLALSRPLRQPALLHNLSAEVNTFQMNLFHHFGTATADTLVFGANVWRGDVLSLSLKHEYLMHAILLLSATHLHHLSPNTTTYHKASIVHLGKALELFRTAIAEPVNDDNADAFVATSMLIYHYVWFSVDFIEPGPDLDLSNDPLFTLSSGVKDVFVNSMKHIQRSKSVFTASALHRPRIRIWQAARNRTKVPAIFDTFFARYFKRKEDKVDDVPKPLYETPQCHTEQSWVELLRYSQPTEESSADDEEVFEAYMDATHRLAPLLSLCRPEPSCFENFQSSLEGSQMAASPRRRNPELEQLLMPDIARYFFSFPIRAMTAFTELIRDNDSRALMVLLYFYRGILALLQNTNYWWAQRRADVMADAIYKTLDARGHCISVYTERDIVESAGVEVEEDEESDPGLPKFCSFWEEQGLQNPFVKDVSC